MLRKFTKLTVRFNSTRNELDHRYCKCTQTIELLSERYLELSSEKPPPNRLG